MAKNGLYEELASDSSSDLELDLPTGHLENPDIETLEKDTELSVFTSLGKSRNDNVKVSADEEVSVSTNLYKPDNDNGDVSVRIKTERDTELSVFTNLGESREDNAVSVRTTINNPAHVNEEVSVSTDLGKPVDDSEEQNHLELPETGEDGDSMVVYCNPTDLVGQASDTDSEGEAYR